MRASSVTCPHGFPRNRKRPRGQRKGNRAMEWESGKYPQRENGGPLGFHGAPGHDEVPVGPLGPWGPESSARGRTLFRKPATKNDDFDFAKSERSPKRESSIPRNSPYICPMSQPELIGTPSEVSKRCAKHIMITRIIPETACLY